MRMKLPVLLAARFREIRWIVFRPQYERLRLTVAKKFCDIGSERSITAFMGHSHLVIQPDCGKMIDRAEMEEQAVAWIQRGRLELPTVPACAIKALVPYSASGR